MNGGILLSEKIRILVTGIGGQPGMGLSRALRLGFDDIEIIGVDCSKYAPGFFIKGLVDVNWLSMLSFSSVKLTDIPGALIASTFSRVTTANHSFSCKTVALSIPILLIEVLFTT